MDARATPRAGRARRLGAARAVWAVALVTMLAACGGGDGRPATTGATKGATTACAKGSLAACERVLVDESRADRLERASVEAYARAREGRTEGDAWAKLWRALAGARGPALVLVLGSAKAPAARVPVVQAGAVPPPETVSADELLLAMGAASGARELVVVEPGRPARQLFPRDPLAPFVGALPAVVVDEATRVDDDVALASRARRAFEHAAELRYVDAAAEADRLAEALDARGPSPATLRGRFALSLLSSAGLVLDPEGAPADKADAAPAQELPEQAGETAYVAYLRVRMAKDDRAEWPKRRQPILAALPHARRDAFDALYGKADGCARVGAPPPIEGPADLVFASKLAAALDTTVAPAEASGAARAQPAPGMLDLAAWLPRYEALVAEVERSKTAWAYATSVLYQRGDALGLSASTSPTYRRATELGLAHIKALRALEQSAPLRWRGLSLLPLAYGPGVLGDERLRDEVLALSQTTVQDKLARSTDAEAVFQAVLTGVAAGLSYPPAIQAAHFVALQGAFTAKLRGDLTTQRGWTVAGLYAADAAYRTVLDEPKNLAWSAEQIARALTADPALAQPALAALATSLSRYAALALEGKLGAAVPAGVGPRAPLPPERLAARAALAGALRGLGAEGEAPRNVLDDAVELIDGMLAAVALRAKAAPRPGGVVCSDAATTTPELGRAVAKLADVRRRILAHPRFRGGDGVWVRRIRLLVTVASDALDLLASKQRPIAFALPTDRAAEAIRGGLREWSDRAAADGVASLYLVVRRFLAAASADAFLAGAAPDVRGAIAGLVAFFRGDEPAPRAAGAPRRALLDALATLAPSALAPGGKAPTAASAGRGAAQAAELLSSWARVLYAQGQRDQGDLLLLAALSAAAASQGPPPADALALAAEQKSRVAWALLLVRETATARNGGVPDPSRYEALMRQATDDACSVAKPDEVLGAMNALRDYASGRRNEARAALDGLLAHAEDKGLVVPKMSYRYEEKTRTRIFALTVDLTYGMPFIAGGNNLQLGIGLKSPGEPEGTLTTTLAPATTPQAGEDAAKFYVELAALATAWHLQAGDLPHASAASSRLLAAVVGGVRLGRRTVTAGRPAEWAEGSRGLFAVDAQLAAEAGLPLLAGDLWTVVRSSLPPDADDKTVDEVLAELPFGLGAAGLGQVVERAKTSLRIVAAPLSCTKAKVELGGFEEPACDRYPLALAFRVADVVPKLPRLSRAEAARCPTLGSLDAFLGAMERKTYDPDAFVKALRAFETDGKAYDAAVLLSRQRSDAHCSAPILASARALGRSPALGATMRTDLLSVAVNCATANVDAALLDDVGELDAQARRVADPQKSLTLMLFVTDLALRSKRWDLLQRVADKDDFVSRWLEIAPAPATAALLVRHAWAVLAGKEPTGPATDGATKLLCDRFPSPDRTPLCAAIKTLRAPGADKAALAEKALRDLVAQATQRR